MIRAYPASLWLDRSRANFLRKRAAVTGLERLRIIVPSQWLAGLVRDSFLGAYPLEVVPNGVDLTTFQPAPAPLSDGKPRVLAVAEPFDARKGFDDVLAVARAVPEAAFHLVGLTPRQLQALPAGVTGQTRTESAAELALLYRAASALINATYEDTYPTVNLEAMACGTPVAAYATGGCVEQVAPAGPLCGALAPTGDVQGLARAVRHALAQDRNQAAAACRTYAAAHFDRAKMIERMMEVYQA
jgi:glycosyltransferase involved in cell wall biosynthesis